MTGKSKTAPCMPQICACEWINTMSAYGPRVVWQKRRGRLGGLTVGGCAGGAREGRRRPQRGGGGGRHHGSAATKQGPIGSRSTTAAAAAPPAAQHGPAPRVPQGKPSAASCAHGFGTGTAVGATTPVVHGPAAVAPTVYVHSPVSASCTCCRLPTHLYDLVGRRSGDKETRPIDRPKKQPTDILLLVRLKSPIRPLRMDANSPLPSLLLLRNARRTTKTASTRPPCFHHPRVVDDACDERWHAWRLGPK